MIPLFKVFMAEDVDDFVLPILHSGYIGEGERVQLFEKEIGKFIQNDNVVAVSSGTAAITMALRLAGVGSDDYVMTIPMTCLATNEPILSLDAVPLWVDIKHDGTMCPDDLAHKISILDRKPKAILCMDWGGLPCDLQVLKAISKTYNIPLIEDACQAIGSVCDGKPIGNHADFVAFSFGAIKHLTMVDGGALIVNNPDLFEKARLMRWFGLDRTKSVDMRCGQDPPTWGYKFQTNDVLASIGLANIRHLSWILEETRRHAKMYDDNLIDCINKICLLWLVESRESNYWLYTLLVDNVKDFIDHMGRNGVACSQVHDRNDTKQMFMPGEDLPEVDYFDKHHVCIPVGWWLKDSEVEQIIGLIKRYDR